jgi:hypothetical protein
MHAQRPGFNLNSAAEQSSSSLGRISECAISRDDQRLYVLEPVPPQEDALYDIAQWDGAGGHPWNTYDKLS